MRSAELIALQDQYSAPWYQPLDLVIACGEGVWVYDVEGRRYLDCVSGDSAVSHGHCHPRLVRALKEQVERSTGAPRSLWFSEWELLEVELCTLTGYEAALLMESSAQAVETALMAARCWGYRFRGVPDGQAEIIACRGNSHGWTITLLSFSSDESRRKGIGPFTPGFRLVDFGDVDDLGEAITPNTVAFLLEPIQGEGGVILPPDGYLRAVADLCHERNILFIADETQSGLGRAGKLFAHQYEAVRPDLVVVGGALSGGVYPLAATLANREVLGGFSQGDLSPFGGNPWGAAVGREALRTLIEENLCERSAGLGAYFLSRLQQLESTIVKDVRGRGLLIGVELHEAVGGARRFCEALKEREVLCQPAREHTIRFIPPLVITEDEIDWATERIEKALA